MPRIVKVGFQPSTIERITAGAAMITPHDSARDRRNSRLASVRVRASKRRSRYSYAVNTFAR